MIVKKKDGKFGEIAVLLTEDEDMEKIEATVRRLLSDHKYWIPREYLHVNQLRLPETGKPEALYLSLKDSLRKILWLNYPSLKKSGGGYDLLVVAGLVDTDITYASIVKLMIFWFFLSWCISSMSSS